jgi:hypothetical protein
LQPTSTKFEEESQFIDEPGVLHDRLEFFKMVKIVNGKIRFFKKSLGLQFNKIRLCSGFVNMVQTGMLALQLLPENSSAGIIVITAGVIRSEQGTVEFLLC